MATGTFSARYMRIFYRDGVFKAVLAVLVGTLTFSYGLLRRVEANSVPSFGVTLAGFFLAVGVLLFLSSSTAPSTGCVPSRSRRLSPTPAGVRSLR